MCIASLTRLRIILLVIIGCEISSTYAYAQLRKVEAKTDVRVLKQETYQSIIQFYEYDRNIPLIPRIAAIQDLPEGKREKIVFAGVNSNLVPAYLVVPKDNVKIHPVVLIADGIYGSKEGWFQDDNWPKGGLITKSLLKNGFAVMILDAVFHGERSAENQYAPPPSPLDYPYTARHMIMQTAIEYRRAMDYLSTRTDIDTTRMGMLGLSMGGLITFQLTSIDSRIKTAIAGLTPSLKQVEFLPIDCNTFASHVGCSSFLMFMGVKDNHHPINEARELFKIIPVVRKEFVEYDAGHEPPVTYVDKVTSWFLENLKP